MYLILEVVNLKTNILNTLGSRYLEVLVIAMYRYRVGTRYRAGQNYSQSAKKTAR